MICPECNLENSVGSKFCVHCGSVLTQAEITAPTAHRTNQVWNTEIEQEQNQKNSRTALIALGAAAVLIVALIAAVFISLPSMGDALIGERDRGQSFGERFSVFWDFVSDSIGGSHEPAPEPGAFAVAPEGVDHDFIELVETYLEKNYNIDYDDALRLPDQYYDKFSPFLTADFVDAELHDCAVTMVSALEDLRNSIDTFSDDPDDVFVADYPLWMEGCIGVYSVAEALYEKYGILYGDSHIPEFYSYLLPIYRAQLEVEYDLTAQLIGIEARVSNGYTYPYITYTNNTPYELDITFYNDYETEDDYFYEDFVMEGLKPNETVDIPLKEMPKNFENWYTDWIVDACYIDGVDIYDYDW